MLSHLLLGVLPFLKVASEDSTVPLYPHFRYAPFFVEIEQPKANLTRDIVLRYDEATWDLPAKTEIETLYFSVTQHPVSIVQRAVITSKKQTTVFIKPSSFMVSICYKYHHRRVCSRFVHKKPDRH